MVVPEVPNENPAVLVVPNEKPVVACVVPPKEKPVEVWVVAVPPKEKPADAWVVVVPPKEKPVDAWVVEVPPKEKPVDAWVVPPKEKPVVAWAVPPKEKPVDGWVAPPKENPVDAWVVLPREKGVDTAGVAPNEKPPETWEFGGWDVGIADRVKPVGADVLIADAVFWSTPVVEGFVDKPKLGAVPREKAGGFVVPKLNAGFVVAAAEPIIEVLEDNEGVTPNVGTLAGEEKAGARKNNILKCTT